MGRRDSKELPAVSVRCSRGLASHGTDRVRLEVMSMEHRPIIEISLSLAQFAQMLTNHAAVGSATLYEEGGLPFDQKIERRTIKIEHPSLNWGYNSRDTPSNRVKVQTVFDVMPEHAQGFRIDHYGFNTQNGVGDGWVTVTIVRPAGLPTPEEIDKEYEMAEVITGERKR